MTRVPSSIPSIKAVAGRAGVSTATVSNVLTARRGVTPELAARVRAAVAELGYIADQGASRLRSRRSTVAGVLVPDIANPFFATFVATVESAARTDGYDLLIVSSGGDPEQEATRLRALLTWRPAGIIVVPCDEAFAARAVVGGGAVPLVTADRIPQRPDTDAISVDNRASARSAAAHLLDQGCRSLLVLASSLTIGNVQERCAGTRDAAAEAGGGAEVEVLEVGFSVAENRQRLAERLASGPLPDAIFALNNLATLATFQALSQSRLNVPTDVALLSFDDDEWMQIVTPPISAVLQPVEQMAREAWRRLLARIGGDAGPPVEIRLGCNLELRGSTLRRDTNVTPAALQAAAQ